MTGEQLPEPYLLPAERANLLDEGVPLDDPRVRLVDAGDDTGYGFDVDGAAGPATVRFDAKAITIEGTWTADGRVDVSGGGSINPDNWKPWYIPFGPAGVKGHRFDDAGVAVRAALRGRCAPPEWGTDLERISW